MDRISSSEDEVSSVSSEEEAPPGSPPPEDSRCKYYRQWMAIARATNRQNRTEGGCVADHVDGSVRLRGRWRVGGGAKRRRGVGRSVGGG